MNGHHELQTIGRHARSPRGGALAGALLAAALISGLGACARPERDRPADGVPQLSRQWLVGGWVLEGDACDSDAGVIHRPDGSWYAHGTSGAWRIEGGALVYLVTDAEDDDGAPSAIEPPERHSEQVRILGPDAYEATREDGTVRRLVRCPQGG